MLDIVMPIWNRREFVALALKSLDKHLDFRKVHRLLLLDDYSEDGAADVAREWATKHPEAIFMQARNPGVSTAWPLFEAFRVLDTSRWLAIWLSDWYMCQPIMPVVEAAFRLGGDKQDAISSVTMRVTKDTLVTPKDVLSGRRRANSRTSIRGGFNVFSSAFLRRVRPKLTSWESISGTFNTMMRKAKLKYSCHWIEPPPAFLHLDEDIPGNKLTQHFYRAEGIDVQRIIDLVRKYHKSGWCRNWVAKDGKTVERAPVKVIGRQMPSMRATDARVSIKPKAWVLRSKK